MRNKKIVSSKHRIGKDHVNWSTWRQFNSIEKDSIKRKELFDEFITKTKYIAPIIECRFNKIKEIYAEYGSMSNKGKVKMNPIDGYLENEKISYLQLIQFIKSLGQLAKKPFRESLTKISEKILGREAEYYDDFYFFRNRVYSDLEKNFSAIDPLKEMRKILQTMQFDLSKIHFDIKNRKNKYPSPFVSLFRFQMMFEFYTKLKAHILIFKDVFMRLVMPYMQYQLIHN